MPDTTLPRETDTNIAFKMLKRKHQSFQKRHMCSFDNHLDFAFSFHYLRNGRFILKKKPSRRNELILMKMKILHYDLCRLGSSSKIELRFLPSLEVVSKDGNEWKAGFLIDLKDVPLLVFFSLQDVPNMKMFDENLNALDHLDVLSIGSAFVQISIGNSKIEFALSTFNYRQRQFFVHVDCVRSKNYGKLNGCHFHFSSNRAAYSRAPAKFFSTTSMIRLAAAR